MTNEHNHEAKAAPAVPQGVIYEKADSLYKRGYTDRQNGKDYDPRGCDEWQEVVDWLTPAAPSQEPQRRLYLDGVNVERLRRAMSIAGCAADPSIEGLAADLSGHINRLTASVVNQAAPSQPAVSQGWQVERKSDYRIRVQSPSGDAWSFENVDDRGSSILFVYQMLDSMLAALREKEGK